MHAMVTARVPVEIKKRGDRVLKEIGSSATELVNDAYEYVLEHRRLPRGAAQAPVGNDAPQVKTLSGSDAERFREQWAQMGVLEAHAYDGHNFKELLDEARMDRYARFA